MVYNKIYAQIGEERHIVLDPINYQYDIKQILVIQGETVPEYYEADICNVGDTATLTMIGTAADGVEIPDRFFRDGRNVLVYVVIPGSSGDVQTRYDITIPSDERGERTDIDLDEDQQMQADSLIAALNAGVEKAEDAAGKAEAEAGKAEAVAEKFSDAVADATAGTRVTSLDETGLESMRVIETVGVPVYVDDVTQYETYGITEQGWYIFARITAPTGVTVGANASVTGAAGVIMAEGADHIDAAVRFEVAAISQAVAIDWGELQETFVFKSTDLAVRNLDYRVTFYVYDLEPFCHWTYKAATDAKFVAGTYYYTKSEDDVYTLAEVTVGDDIPADTYYVHAGLTIEGMTRNVTYNCETPIDCPVTINLPEIEDEVHGAWFEIRFQHTGSFSSTLVVPEGVKVATEHTQPETKGMNTVDLHYSTAGEVKIWRFLNTHSSIPA